jgi:hypothetical protein
MRKIDITTTLTKLESIPWLQTALIVATVTLGLLYIWQVNISATQGYAMRDIGDSIESLATENDKLRFEVSSLQAIDSVSNRIKMLGLFDIGTAEYVKAEAPAVAIK